MKEGQKDTWTHFLHCIDTFKKVNKSLKSWFRMSFSLRCQSNT